MKITLGKFDTATGTVPVTFSHDGKVHCRPVNAVIASDGICDRKATSVRANEVAKGVEHKFALGLLPTVPEEEA